MFRAMTSRCEIWLHNKDTNESRPCGRYGVLYNSHQNADLGYELPPVYLCEEHGDRFGNGRYVDDRANMFDAGEQCDEADEAEPCDEVEDEDEEDNAKEAFIKKNYK